MEDVTKKLPLILSIFTTLTFVGITIHQTGLVKKLRFDLGLTTQALVQTKSELAAEMDKNDRLEREQAVLLDSIHTMQSQITGLYEEVDKLKSKVSFLNNVIQKRDNRISQLTKRLNDLKKSNTDQEQEISRLTEALNKELMEVEVLDKLRAHNKELQEKLAAQQSVHEQELSKLKAALPANDTEQSTSPENAPVREPEKETLEAPLPKINAAPSGDQPSSSTEEKPAPKAQIASHQQMLNIVQNTSVIFSNVSLRNKEDGKDLKKIKGDKWRYSFISFDLDNLDREAIMDETFILQLFDVDKNQVVPFNEQNNIYPDSDLGAVGFKFQYAGRPVLIRYYNYQEKQSANYEIRLVYLNKNMAIPLKNGTLKIVQDGDVIPL
ncbi:MAG: hypothetical protein R2830_06850 [Saprospiraceae bacterium]